MQIIEMKLGLLRTNTYIVASDDSKECIIIDPAAEEQRIVNKLTECGLNLCAILLTHGHFDHIGVADNLRKRFGAKIYAMEEEKAILETPANLSEMIRQNFNLKADVYLNDSDVINIAGCEFKVIYTPGHTIGSCCYYVEKEKVLFSGDTMFCNSYGRTDFPTGSAASIMRSITEKLLKLPDDTKVYPGHEDTTTIGFERHNYDYYQF